MSIEEELKHYGVPGMRWGRRRNLYGVVSAAKKDASELRKQGKTKEADDLESKAKELEAKLKSKKPFRAGDLVKSIEKGRGVAKKFRKLRYRHERTNLLINKGRSRFEEKVKEKLYG